MTLGKRLRELREDNDEKQKDFADLLFVSGKVISDYERGIHFRAMKRSSQRLPRISGSASITFSVSQI